MTKNISLKWGIILGVAVCVWTMILHLLGWYTTDLAKGQIADQVALVLPVVALFMAIREQGRGLERTPTIKEALATGLLTGVVSIPITAGFLWIYHHFINPRWLDLLVAYQREQLARSNASAEEIARRVDALVTNGTDSAQILGAVVGTLLISAVISILVWGVLRASRRSPSVSR